MNYFKHVLDKGRPILSLVLTAVAFTVISLVIYSFLVDSDCAFLESLLC